MVLLMFLSLVINVTLELLLSCVFGSFGVVLMSCKVNFHVVRSIPVCLLGVYFLPFKNWVSS